MNVETKHLGFTAIPRRGPSAPMQWLDKKGRLEGRLLDYGSGRGFDAEHYGMDKYDPHWSPDPPSGHEYDTIICIYVLNVVTAEAQEEVIRNVRKLLAPDGKAYFAVRRDMPRTGRPGKNCYQRWVELPAPRITTNRGFAIYELSNKEGD